MSDPIALQAENEALREALQSERDKRENLEVEVTLLRSRDTLRAPAPVEGYVEGAIRGALAEFAAGELVGVLERTLRKLAPEIVADGIAQYERQRSESEPRCDDCPRRVVEVG